MSEPIRVILSLDVEEEGLFTGRYERSTPSVKNVARLRSLKPLSLDLNLPLTLLCSSAVFADKAALTVLEDMRDGSGAEIGAHLHHWSAPPLTEAPASGPPERTHKLPEGLLRQKLANLLEAGRRFQGEDLISFRMGRWDLKARLLPLLAEAGIRVDSSICPLRFFNGGADHFLAPVEPYWHNARGLRILEAPITQIPVFPPLAKIWRKMWGRHPKILDSFHFFGAMSANPLWHSAAVMRQAARSHIRAGGRLINMFLHSSELMPGGSPNVPDEIAARKVVEKLDSFCRWLFNNYNCQGIVMKDLLSLPESQNFPQMSASPDRDW